MSEYDAMLLREMADWQRNTTRLMVREKRGIRSAYLMEDGTWTDQEDGTALDRTGLILPAGSIEAIARAIQEFQGHASHADTEARILREWLAVEKARVDAVLTPSKAEG